MNVPKIGSGEAFATTGQGWKEWLRSSPNGRRTSAKGRREGSARNCPTQARSGLEWATRPQSLNLYAYVGNNPLDKIDADGHSFGGFQRFGCSEGEYCANLQQSWSAQWAAGAAAAVAQQQSKNILAKLIFSEATPIKDAADQKDEMAAIGSSAINRSKYLKSHRKTRSNFFGAKGRTLQAVITPGQYGGVGGNLWRAAANPGRLDPMESDIWSLSKSIAAGLLSGSVADPFANQGGTYGLRTQGSGDPGGAYFEFDTQIPGSQNTFYGLKEK